MSRLYENEDISIYHPESGLTKDYEAGQLVQTDEELDQMLESARGIEELLKTKGWTVLKAKLDQEIKELTEVLVGSTDTAEIYRLQAAIRSYQNIEGFINSFLAEGQVALDNRR